MKRKILSMILLLTVIFLFACQNEKNGNTDTANTQVNTGEITNEPETEPEISDNLPEIDFGGYNFKMYIEDGNMWEDLYAENENGEILNDTIYYRKRSVEERFNINISPVYFVEWGTPGEPSILAGDNAFDIISSHGMVSYFYVGKNLVVDWIENMPYVDLSKPWWNQSVVNENSFFGKLYAVTGDITASALGSASSLFFNKNLFQKLNIPYPYNDVINGTWTLDKFISIVKDGAFDLNGDGIMTYDADQYGLYMYTIWAYPVNVLYCGGDKVITKDGEGLPFLSVYNERTKNIYDKFFDMYNSGSAIVGGPGTNVSPSNTDVYDNIFREGRALFSDGAVGLITHYRGMEDEIGILPAPKYNESTPKYYTLMEAGARMITVPITVSDFDRTSIIIEAMCVEGYKKLVPTYYEIVLKTKYARDDESADMLDYIKNGSVVDYGYLNNTLTAELALIGTNLVQKNNPNFTSYYEGLERSVQSKIDKLIEDNK